MRSTRELGMKITSAQREYFRYTGFTADVERRGAGASRPELAWRVRIQAPFQSSSSDARPQH